MRWMILSLLLVACSSTSMEDYQHDGESIVRELVYDLEKVESPQDLKVQSSKLKKKFAQLVDLMITAKKYQLKHPTEESPLEPNMEISDSLKAEFVRIYRIEGCQEIMEEIQQESLHRLSRS